MLNFFDWAYKNGGDAAAKLDYVPFPASVVTLIRQAWANDLKADGKPVYTAEN